MINGSPMRIIECVCVAGGAGGGRGARMSKCLCISTRVWRIWSGEAILFFLCELVKNFFFLRRKTTTQNSNVSNSLKKDLKKVDWPVYAVSFFSFFLTTFFFLQTLVH